MNKASNSHSRSKHSLQIEDNHQGHFTQAPTAARLPNNPEVEELQQQIVTLKKQLKQAQLKRNLALKQLSESVSRVQTLQQQLNKFKRKSAEKSEHRSAQKYKVQQLHLLNRELTTELDSLRSQNETLLEKLRHSTTVLETKYRELETQTFSKIAQAMKRIKKTSTYLGSLTGKELEKTRGSLVENLQKSLELLRGKTVTEGLEEQVDELMSPLNVLKEQLINKDRDLRQYKEKVDKLHEQLVCEQKINKELLPQYKSGIEKLKKSLQLCRARIAELQTEKSEVRSGYQTKIKELQKSNKQLNNTVTRLALENKVFQSKMQVLQGEVEQEKQRLMDENLMLKKLYKSQEASPEKSHLQLLRGKESAVQPLASSRSSVSMKSSHLPGFKFGQTEYMPAEQKKFPRLHSRGNKSEHSHDGRKSNLCEQSIDVSQATLRNQIDMISEEINQIQETLKRELEAYSY